MGISHRNRKSNLSAGLSLKTRSAVTVPTPQRWLARARSGSISAGTWAGSSHRNPREHSPEDYFLKMLKKPEIRVPCRSLFEEA